MKRQLSLLLLFLVAGNAAAEPSGDCAGSSPDAVLELPSAMQGFAQLACTPYGHIIMQKDGWTWTYPGGMAPILIASQTARSNPQQLGNASYFRSIEFSPVDADKTVAVLAALGLGTSGPENDPDVFQLKTTNQAGEELSLYFSFDADTNSNWGVWCDEECLPESRFTIQNTGAVSH